MAFVSGVYTSTKHLKPVNKQALNSLSFAHEERSGDEVVKEDRLIDEEADDEGDSSLTELLGFPPCGLEIPEEKIFDSNQALAVSLCAALTGTECRNVVINQHSISVGLGCFTRLALFNDEYDHEEGLASVGPNSTWWLSSQVGFSVPKESSSDGDVAGPVRLFLEISPDGIRKGNTEGIVLVGPWRYLKMIRGENQVLKKLPDIGREAFERYLKRGTEPLDGRLFPSEELFGNIRSVTDPRQKLRLLVNCIMRFYSEVSYRMMQYGNVELDSARAVSRKLQPAWRPAEDDVAAFMRRAGLAPKDLCRKARKLFFPNA